MVDVNGAGIAVEAPFGGYNILVLVEKLEHKVWKNF